MIIKTEEFEKYGIPMIREYVGPTKDKITGIIEQGKPAEHTFDPLAAVNTVGNPELIKPEIPMNEKLMSKLLLNQAIIMQKLNSLEVSS